MDGRKRRRPQISFKRERMPVRSAALTLELDRWVEDMSHRYDVSASAVIRLAMFHGQDAAERDLAKEMGGKE